jgi:hypothetical protein
LENPYRLSIEEMSIEQTHSILLCKGPEAQEFNMTDERNFGNMFTKAEFHITNIYFFLNDNMFQYYVLYFGISLLGFMSDELYYSFHLLDVIIRFP